MLEQDYIMRLFQQFNEMLGKWMSKKKNDNSELIVSFNNEVVAPFLEKGLDFFEGMSSDETDRYFAGRYPGKDERINRLDILAESLYHWALLTTDGTRKQTILRKAMDVLVLIGKHSTTYSLQREHRMAEIKQVLLDCR